MSINETETETDTFDPAVVEEVERAATGDPEPAMEPEPEDIGPKYSHTHLIQLMKYKPGYRPLQAANIAGDFWFQYMGAAEFEWRAIPTNLQRLQDGVRENGVFTGSFLVTYEQVPVDRLRKGKKPHEFVGEPGPYRLFYLDTNNGLGMPVAEYVFQAHLNDVNASYGRRSCYLKEHLGIRGALGVGARWERMGDSPDTWLAFGGATPRPDTIYTAEPFMVFTSEKAMLAAKLRLETGRFVPSEPDFTWVGG